MTIRYGLTLWLVGSLALSAYAPEKTDGQKESPAKEERTGNAETVSQKEEALKEARPQKKSEGEKKKAKAKKKKENAEAIGHPFSWPFVSWEKMKPYGGTTKASRTVTDPNTREVFTSINERGISKKERDRRAILALAGDYRVSFDFIETSSTADHYKPRRPYFSWGTERAFIIADESDFISIQHILVMEFVDHEGKVQGPFTMKHWRQDWSYQDVELLEFQGDRRWKKRTLGTQKGTWTQSVYQVDDSPRYETIGRWVHQGGLSTFQSRQFWRPLPRREFSVRDDYNVLAGSHEIIITPTGWLHTQLNKKVIAVGGELKKVIATELGAVRYETITTPSLAKAEEYWEKTGDYWAGVREKWEAIASDRDSFSLRKNVDEKPMYAHLFGLAGKAEEDDGTNSNAIVFEAKKMIDQFLKTDS